MAAPEPALQPSTSRAGEFVARVVANRPLCREHFCLTLHAEAFPATEPGQFVQILCRDLAGGSGQEAVAHDWQPGAGMPIHDADVSGRTAMLRRPFSLADARAVPGGQELDVIHRVVGVGTAWMAARKVGDRVSIIGPLGNRFSRPTGNGGAILIGGGVGLPPMLFLARRLGDGAGPVVAFCGAASRDLLPLEITDSGLAPDDRSAEPALNVAEFAAHGVPTVLSTDDGSWGFRGYVTEALERYLDARPADERPTLYACGPEVMLKRVAAIAANRGLDCQIAVERAMACGLGTCQSCVIRVADPTRRTGHDWVFKLTCTDGPIFAAEALRW